MFFVVLTFSEHHVETFVNLIKRIPTIGDGLQALLKEFFNEQKRKLHRSPDDKVSEQVSKQFCILSISGVRNLLKYDFNIFQVLEYLCYPQESKHFQGTSILQQLITIVIVAMIARFVYDIINATAKQYHKRVTRPQTKKAK